jgi:hypothetical protein
MDRSGNRSQLYEYPFDRNQEFIIRLMQNWNLMVGKDFIKILYFKDCPRNEASL